MLRVISRVIVRVAAEVAFLTARSVVDVRERDFLPVTLLDTAVPKIEANVAVRAVITDFKILLNNVLPLCSALVGVVLSTSSATSVRLAVSSALIVHRHSRGQ